MFSKYFFLIFTSILVNIFLLLNLEYLSKKFNLIDYAINKSHLKDTPKFGFFLSLIIILYLFQFVFFVSFEIDYLIVTIYFLSFLMIGLFDDLINTKVTTRVFFSIVIVSLFFLYYPQPIFISLSFPRWLNYLLFIFFTLGFLHLINISDGINGYIPLLILYSNLYYLLKAYQYFDEFTFVLCVLTIVCLSVYILPNFLGKTFLGNSGSFVLAIMVSFIYIRFYSLGIFEYSDVLMIYIIPLMDGLRVSFKRIINKKNPFIGDLSHIHFLFKKRYFVYFLYIVLTLLPSAINYLFIDYTVYIALISILLYLVFYIYSKKSDKFK